jgi:hypothetical protein
LLLLKKIVLLQTVFCFPPFENLKLLNIKQKKYEGICISRSRSAIHRDGQRLI